MEDDIIQSTADARLELAVEAGELQRAGGRFPKGLRERSSDMVPAVSVPVLSLQSTSKLPTL